MPLAHDITSMRLNYNHNNTSSNLLEERNMERDFQSEAYVLQLSLMSFDLRKSTFERTSGLPLTFRPMHYSTSMGPQLASIGSSKDTASTYSAFSQLALRCKINVQRLRVRANFAAIFGYAFDATLLLVSA